jgi:hypothetical protein
MAVGDIYRMFVKFGTDTHDGKERYTVEIGKTNLTVVLLDSITSQYENKSDFIKLQYYPIRDWKQAGLKKSSYIDIGSTMRLDFREVLKGAKHIGQLSNTDISELAEFIRSYKERLQAYHKSSST